MLNKQNLFTVFPEFCTTYTGPNTEACAETIWTTTGCIADGLNYPGSLSGAEMMVLLAMNIR